MIGKRIARRCADEGAGKYRCGECKNFCSKRHLITKQALMGGVSIVVGRAGNLGARHSLGCSMQQECLLDSIMTSRRRSQTVMRTARLALMAAACSMLGACAALPEDASVV